MICPSLGWDTGSNPGVKYTGGWTIFDQAFNGDNITQYTVFYDVTVNGSYDSTTGAGIYAPGAKVTINAGFRQGYAFMWWNSTGLISLNNAYSATTFFYMPSNDASVTVSWGMLYLVTVNLNGGYSSNSGAGSYLAGTTVNINAGTKSGYAFSHWTSDFGLPALNNQYSATTYFSLPTGAVSVTANWAQAYNVYIDDAYAYPNGSGSYASGTTVNIHAGTKLGYTFSHWTVDYGNITLADAYSSSTSFNMPPTYVSIVANWTFTGYPTWVTYGESVFHPYDSESLYRVPYELLYFKNNVGYGHNTYAYFDNPSDACYLADSWWWQSMDYIGSYDGGDLYYSLEWMVEYYDNGEWHSYWKK